MPVRDVKLRISTPTEPIIPGRGFYQLEEDSLYVQIGLFTAKRHFFSYLEGEKIRFDLDRTGRLIFFELALPRRRWTVDQTLTPPDVIEPADIRWLNFRSTIPDPTLTANANKTIIRLTFLHNEPSHDTIVSNETESSRDTEPSRDTETLSEPDTVRNYYLAEQVVVSVDAHDRLVAIWVCNIIDDLAGQEIGSFRKSIRSNESFFS